MQLKKIVSIQSGYHSPSAIHSDPKGSHYLIQSKDIDENLTVNKRSLLLFGPERDPQRYLVNKNDILVISRGNSPNAIHIKEQFQPTIASHLFYILRMRCNDVLPEYLSWYLNRPRIQFEICNMAQGTNIQLLSKSDFENLEVEVPAIEQQKIIINITQLNELETSLRKRLITARKQLVDKVCQNILESHK